MKHETLDTFLKQLYDAGMQVAISLPAPGGHQTHSLTQEQVVLGIEDKTALMANVHGVTKADVIAWQNDEYNVYCSGHTKSKRPCRNIVRGGHDVVLSDYSAMQGRYCEVHEERTEY